MRHSQVANARRTGLVSPAVCKLAAFGHGWFDSIPAHTILRKGNTMARYAVLRSDMSGPKGHYDHYLIDAGDDDRLARLFESRRSWNTAVTGWPSGLKSIVTLFAVAALIVVTMMAEGWQYNPMRVGFIGIIDLVVGTGFDDLISGQRFSLDPSRLLSGTLTLIVLVGVIAAVFVLARTAADWLTRRFAPSIFVFDATDGDRAYRRTVILPEQFEQVADGEITAESLADCSETESLLAERQALLSVVDDPDADVVSVGRAVKRIREIETVTL